MKNFLLMLNYLQEKSIDIALGALVMLASFFVARGLYVVTKRVLAERTKDPLMWILLADVFWLFCMLGGVAIAVRVGFGINITNHLFVSAGILSVVMGFAFKELSENFVAGFILALRPPFAIGDFIEYEDAIGRVCEISLRAVRVVTPDGKEVYIPSANLINGMFASLTFMGLLRYSFDLPLAPGFDVKQLEKTLMEAVYATQGVVPKHRRESAVHLMEVKSRYVVVARVFFWVDTHEIPTVTEHSYIRSWAINNTLNALREQGIELSSDTYHVQMGALNASPSATVAMQISAENAVEKSQ